MEFSHICIDLVTTSFGLFARKRAKKEEATHDDRSNRAFPFPSILDNEHLPSSLLLGRCLLKLSRFSSAHSHLFSRSFSLLSRVTHPDWTTTVHRMAQNSAGFNIYGASECGPIPPRSLAFYAPRFPQEFSPVYCCSPCARNIDPRANYIVLFHIQSIHPTSGRALSDARQLSWSIVSHSFGNVLKPSSFIHIARS